MPLREIVRFPIFAQDFEMYQRNYPELVSVYLAMTVSLLDNPFQGKPLEVFPDFRIYLTRPNDNTPAFYVMYSYDTEHIYLHAIKKVEF